MSETKKIIKQIVKEELNASQNEQMKKEADDARKALSRLYEACVTLGESMKFNSWAHEDMFLDHIMKAVPDLEEKQYSALRDILSSFFSYGAVNV